MHPTESSSVILPVECVPQPDGNTEVWLRRDITETEERDDEGLPHKKWEALEVTGLLPGTHTAEEVEEQFDEYWDELETQSIAIDLRLERVQAQAEFTAIMTDTVL